MEEKKLEELTINELKELAESEGVEVTATKKADIIEEINKAREAVTTDNPENNQDDTGNDSAEESDEDNLIDDSNDNNEVDTDSTNKEKSEKDVDKDNKEIKKDIEIPKGFVKKSNLNKKEYGYHNGRKYLKLKNGYGMWADTGQGFNLSDLD